MSLHLQRDPRYSLNSLLILSFYLLFRTNSGPRWKDQLHCVISWLALLHERAVPSCILQLEKCKSDSVHRVWVQYSQRTRLGCCVDVGRNTEQFSRMCVGVGTWNKWIRRRELDCISKCPLWNVGWHRLLQCIYQWNKMWKSYLCSGTPMTYLAFTIPKKIQCRFSSYSSLQQQKLQQKQQYHKYFFV